MHLITEDTIAQAWKSSIRTIHTKGSFHHDGEQQLQELLHVFVSIFHPDPDDLLAQRFDPCDREWMNANFQEIKPVPELHNAWSYGWRLRALSGINQLQWVIDALRTKPETKSATISLLQPAGTDPYIPCVSLLDFKIREDCLQISATCRSLDFGRKAFFNFTNLAAIGQFVATNVDISHIMLFVYIISAHYYLPDWPYIEKIRV